MKNPQIIMFDPDQHYMTVVDLILSTWGMTLTASAHDLKSSTDLVSKIEKGELKPDIAIVEAYMSKSEEDGAKISEKLRSLNPEIKIIGFSTFESEKWADFEAIKSLKDNSKTIVDGLSKFLGKTYELSNEDSTDTNPKQSNYEALH